MSSATSSMLTDAKRQQFERDGFLFPIRVLEDEEVARYLSQYQDYVAKNRSRLAGLKPNQTYLVLSETHFAMKWVYEITRHPRILDAVESIIGPNILAWNTNWFTKMPGDSAYVGWHQDGTYWKLTPHRVVTAWVALTPSIASNGGLQVVGGTHKQPMLPQRETYLPDNALSRGQEIAVQVKEDQATCLELQPGEMSLHDIWIVHGSKANTSNIPRIGMAIRYVSTEVKQDSPSKPLAILVRGRDDFGHFELMPPPTEDVPAGDAHQKIVNHIRSSIMPPAAPRPR
jgi:ectoine hydroxylase-related dioxygenase (phytanoyl-CoA dioxygenase family)